MLELGRLELFRPILIKTLKELTPFYSIFDQQTNVELKFQNCRIANFLIFCPHCSNQSRFWLILWSYFFFLHACTQVCQNFSRKMLYDSDIFTVIYISFALKTQLHLHMQTFFFKFFHAL